MCSGCLKDEKDEKYFNAAKQFNKIYFETVECINVSDSVKSLKEFQTETNKKNIEELNILLEEIKINVPKQKEPHYLNFKQRYEDLLFLYESNDKGNNLSLDERRNIYRILLNIGGNKADWKDKNSTTVWE